MTHSDASTSVSQAADRDVIVVTWLLAGAPTRWFYRMVCASNSSETVPVRLLLL